MRFLVGLAATLLWFVLAFAISADLALRLPGGVR